MKSFPTMVEVVAVALLDEAGQVLMQQRPAGKAHGGLWEFPGGKVEAGESRESALVREVAEELGISIKPGSLEFFDTCSGSVVEDPGSAGLVIVLYTARQWSGQPCNLDADAIGWFDAASLMALEMPPLDVPLAKRIAQLLK